MSKPSAIVVGAGIVGLAMARALAVRGYSVHVIERNDRAVGASIRNFGMIWPIGQPDGALFDMAMNSRAIWKQLCDDSRTWYDEAGSLHTARHDDEAEVLYELADVYQHRGYTIYNADQTLQASPFIVKDGLRCSLYSANEMIVDPRQAIPAIASWLTEKYGVRFTWGEAVTAIQSLVVETGRDKYRADEIFICSGADFETLYPSLFKSLPITKCKLQMMRLVGQPGAKRIGPAICGGLSLIHYNSFKAASKLPILKRRYEQEMAPYLSLGVHVMVSQNEAGELTVGDSHEYGMTHDPFDKQYINMLILQYLGTFARFANESVIETWNGIYPKLTDGKSYFIKEAEPGITIVNGLGGAGMTLSFGLCEQFVKDR